MMAVLTPISRPAEIQQRPARIAGIDRGVGLDHVRDLAAAAGRQPALERADDAAGQRLVEPERVADRKRRLADLEFARTAQRHRRGQLAGVPDPQHREVVVGRDANDLGLRHLPRGKTNRDLAAVLHHVIVGDDMAGIVPDEAGAGSCPGRAVSPSSSARGLPAAARAATCTTDWPRTGSRSGTRNTLSNEYAFALRDGTIYVRPATVGEPRPGSVWRRLELPPCLDGQVREISADHRLLVALGLGPAGLLPRHARWGPVGGATWRCGVRTWTGSGMRMWDDVREWATPELTSAEWFRDTAGGSTTRRGRNGLLSCGATAGGSPDHLDPGCPRREPGGARPAQAPCR